MATEEKDELGNRDAFQVDIDDSALEGKWCWMCECWPDFLNMGNCTMIAGVVGFFFGWLLNDQGLKNYGQNCYASSSSPDPYSCWLDIIEYPGKLWVRALKCLIAPLMASMMLVLPAKLANLGNVGMKIAAFLIFTSAIAALEGLMWGNIFRPGEYISSDEADNYKKAPKTTYISELESFLGIGENAVPQNIVKEMADLRVLGIITFFLLYGYTLQRRDSSGRRMVPKEWADPILNCAKGFLRVTMIVLMQVIWWTPLAMLSLVTFNLSKLDDLGSVFEAVGMYVLTQLLGQLVHLFVFYFIFYYICTGKNPARFYWSIKEAPLTALTCSSSAATLPVTIKMNVDLQETDMGRQLVKFIVGLGATINMDGTSLGFPIMYLFTAQMGKELGLLREDRNGGQQLLVALLSMVSSMGTAPIPSAGIVYFVMLLQAGGIENEEVHALGLGLVFLFDWLVDRVETAQNVGSDSFISSIIAHNMTGGTTLFGTTLPGFDKKSGEAALSTEMGRAGVTANDDAAGDV